MKERELFDKWWAAGDFEPMDYDSAFAGWQARAALLPSVEILKDYIDDVAEGRSTSLEAAQAIRDLLEAVK